MPKDAGMRDQAAACFEMSFPTNNFLNFKNTAFQIFPKLGSGSGLTLYIFR